MVKQEEVISMKINQISTGFIEIPGRISLNIYAQGCKRNCPGCHNPELQSFEGGVEFHLFDVKPFIDEYFLCNWICWLGGDAIYQPKELIEFNKVFKKFEKSICLYTGETFGYIGSDILENVDIVVDGSWNGFPVGDPQSNQRIWQRHNISWVSYSRWEDVNLKLREKVC